MGISITSDNYIDIMALDAKKLGVAGDVLAKALCKLLAHIATAHSRVSNLASVAFPLDGGSNQRRSIIQAHTEHCRLEHGAGLVGLRRLIPGRLYAWLWTLVVAYRGIGYYR